MRQLDEARAFVRERIAATPIIEAPFPHMQVEQALPDWLYADLTANWPDPSFFGQVKPSRKILDLSDDGDGSYSSLPAPLRSFWSELQAEVLQEAMGSALIDKYAPYIDRHFQGVLPGYREGDWRGIGLEYERAGLMLHSPGFQLRPHIDSPHLVIIYLLYCPTDDTSPDEGTDLFDAGEFQIPRRLKTFYPELSETPKGRTMPYRRNTMTTFLVTPRSLHGVTVKRRMDRRVINCAVRVPKETAERLLA